MPMRTAQAARTNVRVLNSPMGKEYLPDSTLRMMRLTGAPRMRGAKRKKRAKRENQRRRKRRKMMKQVETAGGNEDESANGHENAGAIVRSTVRHNDTLTRRPRARHTAISGYSVSRASPPKSSICATLYRLCGRCLARTRAWRWRWLVSGRRFANGREGAGGVMELRVVRRGCVRVLPEAMEEVVVELW
jgi:hypothetical protein